MAPVRGTMPAVDFVSWPTAARSWARAGRAGSDEEDEGDGEDGGDDREIHALVELVLGGRGGRFFDGFDGKLPGLPPNSWGRRAPAIYRAGRAITLYLGRIRAPSILIRSNGRAARPR